MRTDAQPTRWPAVGATIGTAWWLVTVIGLHLVNVDRYNPVEQAISGLAYERLGFFLDIAFIALGLGIFVLAYGLFRSTTRAVAASFLLAVAGILLGLCGVFQTDPPGGETTSGTIHYTIALISFILMIVVMFLFAWHFHRDPHWRSFSFPTLIWAGVALGTFFLFPLLGDSAFGIAQRTFVLAWWSWLFVTALRLRAITVAKS